MKWVSKSQQKAPEGVLTLVLLQKLSSFLDLFVQKFVAGFGVQQFIPNILAAWQG